MRGDLFHGDCYDRDVHISGGIGKANAGVDRKSKYWCWAVPWNLLYVGRFECEQTACFI